MWLAVIDPERSKPTADLKFLQGLTDRCGVPEISRGYSVLSLCWVPRPNPARAGRCEPHPSI